MSYRLKADALAKAALQATARALHTAQLAADAYRKAAAGAPASAAEEDAAVMLRLRDGLLEAYSAAPEAARQRMLASRATISSDELLDLLALCVRG